MMEKQLAREKEIEERMAREKEQGSRDRAARKDEPKSKADEADAWRRPAAAAPKVPTISQNTYIFFIFMPNFMCIHIFCVSLCKKDDGPSAWRRPAAAPEGGAGNRDMPRGNGPSEGGWRATQVPKREEKPRGTDAPSAWRRPDVLIRQHQKNVCSENAYMVAQKMFGQI